MVTTVWAPLTTLEMWQLNKGRNQKTSKKFCSKVSVDMWCGKPLASSTDVIK